MSNKITIKKTERVDGAPALADEAPKDVMERIRTLDDAIGELGEDDDFVRDYRDAEYLTTAPDLLAYLKLRVITAALNEGWEPQFTEDERRYFPWFHVCTKDELDRMSEEDRSRVVGRPDCCPHALGGLVYANSFRAPSYSNTYSSSRLAFRSKGLAEYAGKQFIGIWADYLCA